MTKEQNASKLSLVQQALYFAHRAVEDAGIHMGHTSNTVPEYRELYEEVWALSNTLQELITKVGKVKNATT